VAAEDTALVQHCLEGRPEGMRLLIERFQSDVFGLCFRLLHHRQDAEDVAQEVFVRVFRSLHRWDGARPLKPWIMGITVNRCRTMMGKRVRRPEYVDYLHDKPARDERDDSRELQAELGLAIAQLRPDYQTVFVMFHLQNEPYDVIATAIDRPVGTVKTWLHRARHEVLDCLKRRGMVPDDFVTAVKTADRKD